MQRLVPNDRGITHLDEIAVLLSPYKNPADDPDHLRGQATETLAQSLTLIEKIAETASPEHATLLEQLGMSNDGNGWRFKRNHQRILRGNS